MRYPNNGDRLLPKWRTENLNKNNGADFNNFLQSTITNSPTIVSGATTLPTIGYAIVYIETSSNNHGDEKVFVSWERTDITQISFITFYYIKFSILTKNSLKSMGRFEVQLILEDKTWSTRYDTPKSDRNSNTSTDWTLVSSNFSERNYEINLNYDQLDTPHADMCFPNIIISHPVY